MLTARQHDLLVFIRDYMAASGGVSPSYAEMAEGIGLKSKSPVSSLLAGLETRGFIKHKDGSARAIEILRSPDGTKPGRHRFTPSETVEIVLRQLAEGAFTTYPDENGIEAFTLACVISGDPVRPGDDITLEHMTPLALGGRDDVTNVRIALTKHADLKTNGPAHLKVDGDKSKIAKSKRLSKAHSALQAGEKKAANHKSPKRKLQSRGFRKKAPQQKENQSD